ncbi:MAG: WG repeat-containing protein [Clostridia bacterium]
MAQKKWYNNKRKKKGPADNYVPPFDAGLLAEPIENLELTAEVMEKLKKGNVLTLLDVAKRREKDFYTISTFNKRNLFELKNAVKKKRFKLRPNEEKPLAEKSEEQDRHTRSKKVSERGRGGKLSKERRFDADVSEKRTKEEREKLRPPKPRVQQVQDIYIKINKNGKWGFANRSGREVVAPIYDEVFTYKEDVCCVEKNELFGYIDRQGEEIIPIMYECASSFSEGYACVYKGGYCGYINKQNEVIIDFKFDAGTAVIDGGCRVKRDGKWGELIVANPYEIRWIN